jgi:hypothetical protein
MKVTVDIDCTPEEARRFLGLPDLTPVHEAYVETMRKAMSDAIGPEAIADAVKNWGPMSDAVLAPWKSLFEQMGFEQMGSDKRAGADK